MSSVGPVQRVAGDLERDIEASASSKTSQSPSLLNRVRKSSAGSKKGTGSATEAATDSELCIKVPIVGFETMDQRAKFTVFKLRVENEKMDENWLVFRRYTDFVRLHNKLKEEDSNLQIPLPPKRWWRDNFETAFLEERMKGLQALVDSILIQPNLSELPTVRKFFCLDEPPLYSDSGDESRSWYGVPEDGTVFLKHKLGEKDREIELLRAELALITTQRDNVLKIAKNCRYCSHKQSVLGGTYSTSKSNLSNSTSNVSNTGPIISSSSSSDHGSSTGSPKTSVVFRGTSSASKNDNQSFPYPGSSTSSTDLNGSKKPDRFASSPSILKVQTFTDENARENSRNNNNPSFCGTEAIPLSPDKTHVTNDENKLALDENRDNVAVGSESS